MDMKAKHSCTNQSCAYILGTYLVGGKGYSKKKNQGEYLLHKTDVSCVIVTAVTTTTVCEHEAERMKGPQHQPQSASLPHHQLPAQNLRPPHLRRMLTD